MRLIDADALLHNIRRAVYPSDLTTTIAVGICESHVKDMPTVDAVPIVRCKDCREWSGGEDASGGGICSVWGYTRADYFCLNGERSDEA